MIDAINRSRLLPIMMLLVFLFIPFYCCLVQNVKATATQDYKKDSGQIVPQKSMVLVEQSLEKRRNNVLMVSLMLILLVSLLLYYRLKEKQKLNALIKQMADQKRAVKSLLEHAQDERILMAKDIHNNIGQMLAVAKMNLSNLAFDAQNDTRLNSTLNLIDKTASELRNISQQLLPEGLNFGLFSAIEELCYKINQQEVAKIELQLSDQKEQVQLEKNRTLSIYSVVQEVLADRIKYAQATEIKIKIHQNQQNLLFEITDNGAIMEVKKVQGDRKKSWENIAVWIDLMDGTLQNQVKKITENQVQISLPNHRSND
ncbi:sensor histidine kinase [Pedobacter sp. Hv1]|uniref:sensor histidine kinase n=1 Tax=Pedobacter sp. Hv1 TaxID=1740090 RepID=UPI0006D89A4B|nr:histidine kinase [Pedobacter sp. Hv1]KQB98726.1 hypothetical protein AQF98_20490 [Pedobacter sp. Hv1]